MIRLLPNSSEQTLTIVPRSYPTAAVSFTDVKLVITEDGTGVTETLTGLTAEMETDNDNYVTVAATFSILGEGNTYFLEFTRDGVLWYRDKAYVTAQTNNKVNHTLNSELYDSYTDAASDEYIVI